MSTLTGLYGGGASGGGGGETHIVTDPKKLPRFAGRASGIYVKTDFNVAATSSSSGFDTALQLSDFVARGLTTASDTYTTVLDVTSAPNGGYLYWVLSPTAEDISDTVTVKITVDGGTPVELSCTNNDSNGSYVRLFLGGGLSTRKAKTSSSYSSDEDPYGGNIFYLYGFNSTMTRAQDFSNGVMNLGSFYTLLQSSMPDLLGTPSPQLYFSSSLKVEVKQSNYDAATNYRAGYCFYRLI